MNHKGDGMSDAVRHLYLHIPFCAKICPYCCFYVHGGSRGKQVRFVEALCREMEMARNSEILKPATIYCGGGTPSMLSADLFQKISDSLGEESRTTREFTLEVNPATVTPSKARAWREAGVNRISLGVQSFDSAELQLLGRQHTPEEVKVTVKQLRDEGFSNISIDLIFGLPGQSLETWTRNLEAAVSCQPEHLSAYALTYEEDTPFFQRYQKGEFLPDEAREVAMFECTDEILGRAGIERYEISNFAKPGRESVHNQAYWEGNDYRGFGPSAVSTVGGIRSTNVKDTARYTESLLAGKSPEREEEKITREIRNRERMLLGLRTREGIEASVLDSTSTAVKLLMEEGYLERDRSRFRLTSRGRLVADRVALELFSD